MSRTYPTLPGVAEKSPAWGFFCIWRRGCVDEPTRFDKFVRNEFGQPNGWPGARSAEGEAQG